MNSRFPAVPTFPCWLLVILTAGLMAMPAFAQVNVLTQRYNNARTGANMEETELTPSNVNVNGFGKLFSLSVDGSTQASPLYVQNVTIPGKGVHNVLYIATMNDKIYAFDGDTSSSPLWMDDFTNPSAGITAVPITDIACACNVIGNVGIESTPVIDPATNTLFLVARTKENGSYVQRLHALDITTGAERAGSPVAIHATVSGTGTGSSGGKLNFDPFIHNQRPSLALANGKVFIAWASHEDTHNWHGWVIAYDENTLAQAGALCTSPNDGQSGIWESGWGPAVDASGNVYYMSGNGTGTAGANNLEESIFKLNTISGVQLVDWFTPSNWAALNSNDVDVASAGSLLIPGTNLLVGGGKEAVFYVLDTGNMGHQVPGDTQIVQQFAVNNQGTTRNGEIKGGPVYWNRSTGAGPWMYVWAENDFLKAYHFNGLKFDTTPASQSTFKDASGASPGVLTLSSNGDSQGIVWSSMCTSSNCDHGVHPGILRAFDATNLTKELWNSGMNATRDNAGNWPKFSIPLVVNGKVYLGSFSNQVNVYGLLSPTPDFTLTASPATLTVIQGNAANYTATVGSLNNFTGTVSLTISGLPSGATASFTPATVSGSGSSTLAVTTSTSTPAGTYTLTVHGASSTLSHTTTVTLKVNPITSLPPGWNSTDIGTPGMAGSSSFSNGTFTVSGSGSDIWSTSDNFQYAFQSVTGDQAITARVASQQNTSAWAKAGVMIRQTTAANSAYVFVMITPSNGVNMQYRPTNGGTSVQLGQQLGHVAPYWVRLVRSGNTFTGFSSADGTTWTQVGTISVTMSSGVTAGLAVTAHNNAALSTSTFDNVSITAPVSTPDFTLLASPSPQTISPGGSANYTVTVGAVNGFSGNVTLSASGPAAVATSLSPTSVSGSGSATLSAGSSAAGTYTLTITGTSGSLSHSTTVTLVVQSACLTTSTMFQNTAFPAQTGTFTATFDGTPSAASINSVMALSQGPQPGYTGFATLARFNPSDDIDARDAGAYNVPSPAIPYAGGSAYHFRLVINIPAHTYSAFVTPPGGTELTIGTDLAFRTEQNTVTSLDNFGIVASTGSNTVCNFAVQ